MRTTGLIGYHKITPDWIPYFWSHLIGSHKITPVAVADAQLLSDRGAQPAIMAMDATQVHAEDTSTRVLLLHNTDKQPK